MFMFMMMSSSTSLSMWSSVIGLFLVALAVVSFTHYWYRWSNPKCNGRLPPGSMGFPLIGETLQFLIPTRSLDMPHFIKKRIARYGTLFRTSLAGRRVVISSDPEFNYYIFQQEGKLVELWYMDSFAKLAGQNSSSTSIGRVHKYIRNRVLDQFGTESLKEKLLSKIEFTINQSLQSWSSQPSIEFKASLGSMIIDFSAKEILNYNPSSSSLNLSEKFEDFFQGLVKFPLNIPGTTFHKCLKNREIVSKLIKDTLHERLNWPPEKERYGDFLDKLADDMKKEDFLTEEFVISFTFGLLFANSEGVSTSLTVAMMLLSDQPSVVKELIEEHEAILKKRKNVDSSLTWEEYKSMTFTSQVINETLRMSSLSPGIIRRVIKDIHINGYVIPEGWALMVVPSALHMNPKKFEDPLTFNPARWKDRGSNTVGKNFIPFGGGARNCAGGEFSKMTMAVFLHVMLTKFSWKKIKGGHAARKPALVFEDGLHLKIFKKE